MSGNIAPLAKEWLQAKLEEDYARARRVEIENQMAGALEVPAEGSKTHKIDGYKVTVTQPIIRKVDAKSWDEVKGKISPDMWPIKTKVEADATGCKYLANNEPEVWATVSSAFTATPGKIGFKIEEVQ